MEQRGRVIQRVPTVNRARGRSRRATRSRSIFPSGWFGRPTLGSRRTTEQSGVDAESVEMFEQDLKNNLYKIWNRMSSGTYFPPPVRSVGIPKKDGSERRLGIPTVADRIAQTVVKMYLEPDVEPQFHPDSYGYRPRKSAIDALTTARQRCWRYDWVIDLDIRGFFDNLDHALVMRAVRKYTRCRWILLYVQRQIGPVYGLSPLQWPVGSMGHAEIQKATATSPSSQSLARWPCSSRAPAVRPLASAGGDTGGWMMGAV